MGRLVDIGDTALWVEERGDENALPLLVLHGGPGLDHHSFGDYLDPLADDGSCRLVLVDERAQGRSDRSTPPETWTLERMAADVTDLARALGAADYVVLGHSFGSFLALRHAVDFPGAARATIVSAGVPSARWLERVEDELARFEPEHLRTQVTDSWAREADATTEADVAALMTDQMPFHFRDPESPLLADYAKRTDGARYAPDVLRHFSTADYGGLDIEERLREVRQPVLVLGGRFDRTCQVEASEELARLLPAAELVIFEESAHMMYVEENARYLDVVRDFLRRL
jgi:proline-specific peptidase